MAQKKQTMEARAARSKQQGLFDLSIASMSPDRDREMINAFYNNPTSGFFKDNFDLVKKTSILSNTIRRQAHRLIGKGIVFMLPDGVICRPTAMMQSLIDAYWISFYYKVLVFYYCTGKVVWFISHNLNGVEYPDVPEWDDIEFYDPSLISSGAASGNTNSGGGSGVDTSRYVYGETRCRWRRPEQHAKYQLYVDERHVPAGVPCVIDSVKDILFYLYHIDRCQMLTYQRIGQPDVMIQTPPARAANINNGETLPPTDAIDAFFMQRAAEEGEDDVQKDRFEDARAMGEQMNMDDLLNQDPLPPWVRALAGMAQPVQQRFRWVPPGMTTSIMHATGSLNDYFHLRMSLRAELLYAFDSLEGTGASLGATASKAMPAGGTGEGAAIGGGGGGGGGGAKETPTEYALHEMLSRVGTNVFRILHDQDSLEIGDIKTTWHDERVKLYNKGETVSVPELFAGRGDKGYVEHTNKRMKMDSQAPAPEPPRADYLLRENPVITLMMTSHILAHRDTAAQYMKQGFMSEESYYEMHPPVETVDAGKKKRDKEKEEMAKEREKLDGDKEKMKQEEKERKLREELDEMKKMIKKLSKKNKEK